MFVGASKERRQTSRALLSLVLADERDTRSRLRPPRSTTYAPRLERSSNRAISGLLRPFPEPSAFRPESVNVN